MKTKNRIFLVAACSVLLLSCSVKVYAADPGDSVATCDISLTVDSIIEWEGGAFPNINLTTITAHADSPEGQSNYTLWTNCNVTIAADTLTNDARLTDGTDTIRTEYQLSTDGDGDPATGADAAAIAASNSDEWTIHNLFLATPLLITHYNTDGGVEITLYVKAVQEADEVPDSGDYTAQQTLTAAWDSDD